MEVTVGVNKPTLREFWIGTEY